MIVSSDSPRASPVRRGPALSPASMDRALWAARAPIWAPCRSAVDPLHGAIDGPGVPGRSLVASYLDPAGPLRRDTRTAPGQGVLPPPAILQWGDVRYVRVSDDFPGLAPAVDLDTLTGARPALPDRLPGTRIPRTPSRRRSR